MLVGYARVSTQEQTLAFQKDALKKARCERICTDTVSGAQRASRERGGLTEALEFMRLGDTLVVWKLDRLWEICQAPGRDGASASRAGYRVHEPD